MIAAAGRAPGEAPMKADLEASELVETPRRVVYNCGHKKGVAVRQNDVWIVIAVVVVALVRSMAMADGAAGPTSSPAPPTRPAAEPAGKWS